MQCAIQEIRYCRRAELRPKVKARKSLFKRFEFVPNGCHKLRKMGFIKLNVALQMLPALLRFPDAKEAHPECKMSFRQTRVEVQRLFVPGKGFFSLTDGKEGDTQIVVKGRELGISVNTVLQYGDQRIVVVNGL